MEAGKYLPAMASVSTPAYIHRIRRKQTSRTSTQGAYQRPAMHVSGQSLQCYSATDHRLGAEAIPDPWQDKSNCSAAVHDCLYCALAQNPWQNTTICDDWRVNHHRRLRTATSASLAAVDRRACCKLCEPLPPHRVASNVACRVSTAQPSFQARRVGSA